MFYVFTSITVDSDKRAYKMGQQKLTNKYSVYRMRIDNRTVNSERWTVNEKGAQTHKTICKSLTITILSWGFSLWIFSNRVRLMLDVHGVRQSETHAFQFLFVMHRTIFIPALSNGLLNFNHIWFPMWLIPVKRLLSLFVCQRWHALLRLRQTQNTTDNRSTFSIRLRIADNDVIMPKVVHLCYCINKNVYRNSNWLFPVLSMSPIQVSREYST